MRFSGIQAIVGITRAACDALGGTYSCIGSGIVGSPATCTCYVPEKSSAPQSAGNQSVNVQVSPNIQTQASPQISPAFQQQYQPTNSPATAGTQQITPSAMNSPSTTIPASGGITAADLQAKLDQQAAQYAADNAARQAKSDAVLQAMLDSFKNQSTGANTVQMPVTTPSTAIVPAPVPVVSTTPVNSASTVPASKSLKDYLPWIAGAAILFLILKPKRANHATIR